jgi:hypothetical protein
VRAHQQAQHLVRLTHRDHQATAGSELRDQRHGAPGGSHHDGSKGAASGQPHEPSPCRTCTWP